MLGSFGGDFAVILGCLDHLALTSRGQERPRLVQDDFSSILGSILGSMLGAWRADFPIFLDMFFLIFFGPLFGRVWGRFLVVLEVPGAPFFEVFWKRPKT